MRNAGSLSAGFFACDLRVGHITYGTAGRPRICAEPLWQGRAIVNRE